MLLPSPIDSVVSSPFELAGPDGSLLFGDIRRPGLYPPHATIVFVHGFRAFKDWGPFPYVCRALAAHGFSVISFNFSRNGVVGHGSAITRTDLFVTNTISRELSELNIVLEAVRERRFDEDAGGSRLLGLLGHSRGGALSILAAAADHDVRGVAVWGAIATIDRMTERRKEFIRRTGLHRSSSPSIRVTLEPGPDFLDDLDENRSRLDIRRAVERLARPLLVLHGEQDLVVRTSEAQLLAGYGDPRLTTLKVIPHASHTFGTDHPFSGTTPPLERAIDETARFFLAHLTQS